MSRDLQGQSFHNLIIFLVQYLYHNHPQELIMKSLAMSSNLGSKLGISLFSQKRQGPVQWSTYQLPVPISDHQDVWTIGFFVTRAFPRYVKLQKPMYGSKVMAIQSWYYWAQWAHLLERTQSGWPNSGQLLSLKMSNFSHSFSHFNYLLSLDILDMI